jgi:hypothetical protein
VEPANVTIEFFPDEGCTASIARQIKSTHRAYSLFDLARMFLARPERHRLKISTKNVAEPLHQTGEDGPIALDKAMVERAAFPLMRDKFYVEITEHREAPKGNFSNVARCRANGVLLGPTNYHGYQPALRKLYEERFSRRMSFAEFQHEEIEVVSDPALVEQWKQNASSITVYRLKPAEAPKEEKKELEPAAETAPAVEAAAEPAAEAAPAAENAESAVSEPAAEAAPEAPKEEEVASEPEAEAKAEPVYEGPVFASLNEVERHFRENYLPRLIRTASAIHISGTTSRSIPDRGIAAAVRQAWEGERGFPGQMMHQLRQHFSRQGLHVFKHRKRMQFVSLIRPFPMEDGSLSPSVAEILRVIQENQNCNRVSLAASILGTDEAAIDPAKKSTLATDLHWLIETGRVIEFSDGKLELPVVPVKQEEKKSPGAKAEPVAAKTAEEKGEPASEVPAPVKEETLSATEGAQAAVTEVPASESPETQAEVLESPVDVRTAEAAQESNATSAVEDVSPVEPVAEEAEQVEPAGNDLPPVMPMTERAEPAQVQIEASSI